MEIRLQAPTADDAEMLAALPPEAVNYFHFTYSGPEVELLAGYIDLNLLIAPPNEDGAVRMIKPELRRRLVMSVRGFIVLEEQVKQIAQKMREAGLLPEISEIEGEES